MLRARRADLAPLPRKRSLPSRRAARWRCCCLQVRLGEQLDRLVAASAGVDRPQWAVRQLSVWPRQSR